jgi:hypothetical protein
MAKHHNPLTQSENLAITATLAQLKARLEEAGELLAAVHVEHTLQCLDPENPINQQTDPRGKNSA